MPITPQYQQDPMRNFRFRQFGTSSPLVNQANSEVMKGMESSPSVDLFSGAKQGVKAAVDKQQEVDPNVSDVYDNLTPDHSPTGEMENSQGVQAALARFDNASRLLSRASDPQAYAPQLAEATNKAVGLREKASQFDVTKQPVSRGRKIAGIAAGIGTGIMSGDPLAGIGMYKGITQMPAREKKAQMEEEASAAEKAAAEYGVVAERQKGLADSSMNVAKGETELGKEMIGTRVPKINTGTSGGNFFVSKTNPLSGQTDVKSYGNGTQTKFESKAGSVDGKDMYANFNPTTGKYSNPDTGEEIKNFIPKTSESTSDFERKKKIWLADPKNAGKSESDFLHHEEFDVPESKIKYTFDVNNPQQSRETVGWAVQQILDSPTPNTVNNVTRGNKAFHDQVLEELAKQGINTKDLTAATRQLGETANALIPKFDKTIKDLKDPKLQKKLGPFAGRWNDFMTTKWGSGDPDFAALQETVKLLSTGLMRAHVGARGGGALIDRFDKGLNTGKMDAKTLTADLQAARDFISGYRDEVYANKGKHVAVTAPDGSIHIFDSEDSAQTFRDLISQTNQTKKKK